MAERMPNIVSVEQVAYKVHCEACGVVARDLKFHEITPAIEAHRAVHIDGSASS